MNYSVNPENEPVTVVVSRLVKPGCEQAYEQWIKGITQEAMKFEGHLGIHVIRPPTDTYPEYVLIFKFDQYANLKKWIDSEVRQQWLEKSEHLVQENPKVQILRGMEAWFTLPGRQIKPPPRYKMAIILWLAVFTLLNIVPPLLAPIIGGLPPILRLLITSAIMVWLMTYLVMPFLTKLFYRWLYPRK